MIFYKTVRSFFPDAFFKTYIQGCFYPYSYTVGLNLDHIYGQKFLSECLMP